MHVYQQDVEDLAVPHRAKAALRRLMSAGPLATPEVRRGLHHEDPLVVVGCCDVLDHFLDAAAVPDLIELLAHDDEYVRARSMHALACDRCKEGACRPGEDDSIPLALAMLERDASAKVRAEAVALLAPAAHHRADVAAALVRARDFDPSPNVRKQAGLRAPGGSLYLRHSPDRATRRSATARKPQSLRRLASL